MKTVKIYALEDNLLSEGCGCNTTANTSSCCGSNNEGVITNEAMSINKIMNDFKINYPSLADISIITYNDSDQVVFIDEVNSILKSNGEQLEVDAINATFVLPKLLPLVTVNGKLVAINAFPMGDVLVNAIKTEERIPKQAGCC